MDNRDMFYNSYGYSSGYPMNQMFQPNMMFPNQNNLNTDIENRLNRIERQINRLNQRITRLERQYINNNNNNYNKYNDSNYYMV